MVNELIFALDIGTRSIIGTVGKIVDNKFQVVYECYKEHEERSMIDGQIHDIDLVAKSVRFVKEDIEKNIEKKLTNVSIAAAGRFLRTSISKASVGLSEDKEIDKDSIRSLELTAVRNAEEAVFSSSKGKLYCVGYSVKNYYLNGYLMSNLLSHKGEEAAVEVIATFLPRSVVDSLYAVMNKVDLTVTNITLEPIAAIEAVIPKSLRLLNIGLIDIGAGTSDIAISSANTISAYGMVPMAGDEITEALAQNYLVDFNMAENMKKQCLTKDEITYTDVLGLENSVSRENIIKVIEPVVHKISHEIAIKVLELNGEKPPNALFLVGGGAHTPGIKEALSKEIGLPIERIAIKGREGVTDCLSEDNSLGSIGVTVLGIALVSIKNLGNDFIDVILDGNVVSLFNSHKNKVMDVLLQGGVNPKVLIGKNGKNLKFKINGVNRVMFGTLGQNAKIRVNGKEASLEDEVREGDIIDLIPAVDGEGGSSKIVDHVKNIYSTRFTLNEEEAELTPLSFLNGHRVSLFKEILPMEEIEIRYPKTVGDLRKYYIDRDQMVLNEGKELDDNYVINDGDSLHYSSKEVAKEIHISKDKDNKYDEKLKVVINGKETILRGKKEYIFVDIFDFIDFDLSEAKGNIVLENNGKGANYYDILKEGDMINIYWK
ncbi:cell division protein FtsA [Clostridium hydrogeniformans]|uniref:cell division protein FtsA n=1 Tax=Clostridium hydrogeniformans TaxID=349933 RepID=UPI000550931C|nr:cell division protein FtsA [Clostridium hydrogeniformans]